MTWTPETEDFLLSGTLLVRTLRARDENPLGRQRVVVESCGFK